MRMAVCIHLECKDSVRYGRWLSGPLVRDAVLLQQLLQLDSGGMHPHVEHRHLRPAVRHMITVSINTSYRHEHEYRTMLLGGSHILSQCEYFVSIMNITTTVSHNAMLLAV